MFLSMKRLTWKGISHTCQPRWGALSPGFGSTGHQRPASCRAWPVWLNSMSTSGDLSLWTTYSSLLRPTVHLWLIQLLCFSPLSLLLPVFGLWFWFLAVLLDGWARGWEKLQNSDSFLWLILAALMKAGLQERGGAGWGCWVKPGCYIASVQFSLPVSVLPDFR